MARPQYGANVAGLYANLLRSDGKWCVTSVNYYVMWLASWLCVLVSRNLLLLVLFSASAAVLGRLRSRRMSVNEGVTHR